MIKFASTTSVIALVLGALLPFQVQAQDRTSRVSSDAPAIVLNIPPQDLNGAILAFADRSGLQVFYDTARVQGLRSQGAQGTFTSQEALSRILSGTGLTYRFTGRRSVTVAAPSQSAAQGAGGESATTLAPIVVQGSRESAWGPVDGFVAERSATGTKTDTPLLETSEAISVVTQDQVRQQGAQSIKEALNYSSGVAAATRTAFSGVDIMYSRGFALDRYLDGTKVLGGAGYTVPQIEPYGIERLEVLHGPSSVLYGQVSPGGLVDAISKRPLDTPFHEVEVGTGNFNRAEAAFDFSGPVNSDQTLLYRLTGVVRRADSQVDFTDNERYYLAPALTFQPDADTSLTLLANVQHEPSIGLYSLVPATGTVLSSPFGRISRDTYLGDPSFNEYSRDQQSIGYAFEHHFDDNWTVRQNLRFMHTDGEIRQLLPLFLDPDGRTLERYSNFDQNNINALTIDNQVQGQLDTGSMQHTVLLGFDYQHLSESDRLGQDFATPINIFDPVYGASIGMPPIVSDTTQVSNQYGLYAQDQIKIDRFNLTLAGRQDWVDSSTRDRLASSTAGQDDHAFTWKVGVNYVFDSGIAPYASYSTSFQPVSGVDVNSRPFEPTTGQQYEIGIKYQPPGSNILLTAAAFDLTQQNVLTTDNANPGFKIQTGEIRSRGVELEAKASLLSGLDLIASYSHANVEVTKSDDVDLGKRPVNIPADTAALWAFYTVQSGALEGLGFGGGMRYVGSAAGSADNSLIVPSNILFDAAMRYDFGKRWKDLDGLQLAVNATNLFDKRYVSECSNEINCLYGPGRTVTASLRYRW